MGMVGGATIAIKQLVRGYGLRVVALTSAVTTALALIAGSNLPKVLLSLLPILSTLSAVFTDERNVRSGFYAMVIVGATLKHVMTYSTTVALVYSAMYVIPLALTKHLTLLEDLILLATLLITVTTTLTTYYVRVRKVVPQAV